MLIDLPLDELRTYSPDLAEPPEFDHFWRATLAEVANHPLAATFEPVDDTIYTPRRRVRRQLRRLWRADDQGLAVAARRRVVAAALRREFHTAMAADGRCRSIISDRSPRAASTLSWTRAAQGSSGSPGNTPGRRRLRAALPRLHDQRDRNRPQTYYYRRVFTDAVRAVEAACAWPQVDAERVAVAGTSQGGGIALAVAGLVSDRVRALVADVPFLCHFRRATEITDNPPYAEIKQYLACHRDRVDDVFGTLAYFDGVHFASRVQARSRFSVGLMDATCPPSTVFAAYNARVGGENDSGVRVQRARGRRAVCDGRTIACFWWSVCSRRCATAVSAGRRVADGRTCGRPLQTCALRVILNGVRNLAANGQ